MATAKAVKDTSDKAIHDARHRQFDELMEWMQDNGARLCFSTGIGDRGDSMALYQFAGRSLIVQTYAGGHGWEFYAPFTDATTWDGTKAALQAMLDKIKS